MVVMNVLVGQVPHWQMMDILVKVVTAVTTTTEAVLTSALTATARYFVSVLKATH